MCNDTIRQNEHVKRTLGQYGPREIHRGAEMHGASVVAFPFDRLCTSREKAGWLVCYGPPQCVSLQNIPSFSCKGGSHLKGIFRLKLVNVC